MAEALDLLESEHLTREGHDHLMRECPWYQHVEKGGRDHPDLHCRPATGGGGALVKFTPRTPEASTVVKPTVPPGGPGLFHMKGHHLPPYIEHLYPHLVARYGKHDAYRVAVGVVKKWAAGVNPGGYKTKSGKGKRTHPDVRAAAQKNVAEWEKERAEAHAHHGDHVKASAPGVPGDPGGVYRNPQQTIAPSPPLPPSVPMPTAAEVRAVIPLVPDCSDASLSATARKFLDQAAAKLEREAPLDALAMLRSAQAALYSGHKADLGDMQNSARIGNLMTREGQASSATTAMAQGREKAMAWRKAEQRLGALADRIRKRYFHGVYNGPSQMARFTEDDDMTALDRVLALAAVTGKDVSEPTVSDVSGRTPLIQVPETLLNIDDAKASAELAALPAVDKAKVSAYLDRAREMLATNPAGAAQSAIHAAVIAHEAGARHLARHIKAHVQALSLGSNTTHEAGEAGTQSAGGKTVAPHVYADSPHIAKLAAASAGHSAGASAGHSVGAAPRQVVRQAPGPDAHQLHTEHVEHLHKLHTEHVEHLHHLHVEHVEHMEHLEHEGAARSDTAKKPAAATPQRSEASRRAGATAHATAERTVAADRAARAKARAGAA